jgi:hypothetical protein
MLRLAAFRQGLSSLDSIVSYLVTRVGRIRLSVIGKGYCEVISGLTEASNHEDVWKIGGSASPYLISTVDEDERSTPVVFNQFCSRIPRCNSSTLYSASCWCII